MMMAARLLFWILQGSVLQPCPVPGPPTGIALDARDNLYVANNATRAIAVYATGGAANPTTFAGGRL